MYFVFGVLLIPQRSAPVPGPVLDVLSPMPWNCGLLHVRFCGVEGFHCLGQLVHCLCQLGTHLWPPGRY